MGMGTEGSISRRRWVGRGEYFRGCVSIWVLVVGMLRDDVGVCHLCTILKAVQFHIVSVIGMSR